jgi:hypothetical protein
MATVFSRRPFWVAVVAAALVVGILSTPAGRELAQKLLGSLRLQKVEAVNVDLTPFVNANANPALHQMVSDSPQGHLPPVGDANVDTAEYSVCVKNCFLSFLHGRLGQVEPKTTKMATTEPPSNS